jgi:hypothetical protein
MLASWLQKKLETDEHRLCDIERQMTEEPGTEW